MGWVNAGNDRDATLQVVPELAERCAVPLAVDAAPHSSRNIGAVPLAAVALGGMRDELPIMEMSVP